MKTIGLTPDGRPIFDTGREVYSEKSITVEDPRINNGKPTNIPTVFSGHVLQDPEDAIRVIENAGGRDPETGRKLRAFKDIPSAVKAAEKKSESLNRVLKALGYE